MIVWVGGRVDDFCIFAAAKSERTNLDKMRVHEMDYALCTLSVQTVSGDRRKIIFRRRKIAEDDPTRFFHTEMTRSAINRVARRSNHRIHQFLLISGLRQYEVFCATKGADRIAAPKKGASLWLDTFMR